MLTASRLLAIPLLVVPAWLLAPQDRPAGSIAPPQNQENQARTAPFAREGRFLRDADTCIACHDDEGRAIAAGVHRQIPRSPLLDACETCHGPGALHSDKNLAEQITVPAKLPAAAQEQLCGRCHADQLAEHGGPLAVLLAAGQRCTSCHKVHQQQDAVPGATDGRRFTDRATLSAAASVQGLETCASCHRDKPDSLVQGTHRPLLASRRVAPADLDARQPEHACEACHGSGSLHVATNGVARFVTRPDRAADGIATCRQCHAEVDREEFHWKGRPSPLLGTRPGETMSCTTCHTVHRPGDPMQAAGARALPAADADLAPDACMRCHAPVYGLLRASVHEALAEPTQSPGHGCIGCHPGGAQHAVNGGRKAFVLSLHDRDAAMQSRVCLECHRRDGVVCGFSLGVHARAEVSCLACHGSSTPLQVHGVGEHANERCASCHTDVALSFRHANRHPVGEARFQCASCHDPHLPVATGPRAARRLQDKCVQCHREYRGPFVFQHQADKGDGCLACHFPHGSSNRKLLHFTRARELCLSCHADLPPFHDQSPGAVYRNCLDCHTQVHGSNRNRFFFR